MPAGVGLGRRSRGSRLNGRRGARLAAGRVRGHGPLGLESSTGGAALAPTSQVRPGFQSSLRLRERRREGALRLQSGRETRFRKRAGCLPPRRRAETKCLSPCFSLMTAIPSGIPLRKGS